MNVIEVDNISKAFRIPSARRDTIREHALAFFWPRRFEELQVLQSVSFAIRRGETVGIMGRNGSGKSTLLRILAGIYEPDAGKVQVRGTVTSILQLGLAWNGELTARDNLLLTGTAMGMTLHQVHRDFDEIIAFAELERFVDLEVKHYSSGMSARLAYSIAFHAVSEILLLDEIFAVGDVAFMERCRRRFRELHAAGHTIILVAHDPGLISEHCQRALLLEGGRILLDDGAAKVGETYREMLRAHG